jgi:hypothetical protein
VIAILYLQNLCAFFAELGDNAAEDPTDDEIVALVFQISKIS